MAKEKATKENPWKLKTPPGTSEYEMYKDVKDGKEIIVCTVGKTVLHYDAHAINDLHAMLKNRSMGSLTKKSCWWLVWIEERISRKVWNVHAAVDGRTRSH